MKNLIIIGAGGFGREVYNLSLVCKGYNTLYKVKGFLNDTPAALDKFQGYPPVIGAIGEHIIEPEDVFVCAMGVPSHKRKCAEKILNKGGKFISLIHPTVHIGINARIGKGCIIFNSAFISNDSSIEDFVTIQSNAAVGHDVQIGSWCEIENSVFFGGGVIVGDETTVHTHAVVKPRITVGSKVTVAMGSVVIRSIPDGITVFGNPAKRIFSPK